MRVPEQRRLLWSTGAEMERIPTLPITHPARIAARDAKLLDREERLADVRGDNRMHCKCRICIGSVRSKRKREHCKKHLRDLGRHPYHRGITRVSLAHCSGVWNSALLLNSAFSNLHGLKMG